MNKVRTYLDFNASAPLLPVARAAMMQALEFTGNASSIHGEGRASRSLVETARAQVGALVGMAGKHVVFTSGGTEAANLALAPKISLGRDLAPFDLLLISAGEHACVLSGHRFAPEQTLLVPLDGDGRMNLDVLSRLLEQHSGKKIMLALQLANNETGVIQPVAEAAALVHAQGGVLVCDAVQAAGKVDCNLAATGADFLALSAHKLGGAKGAGALVYDRDRLHIRDILLRGGGQEGGTRAGTENVAAIAAFGAAASASKAAIAGEGARLEMLRNEMERQLLAIAPGCIIFGNATRRLPNTLAFAVPGLSAETLLIGLDLEGIAVSSGSACSSGKVKRSHVLDAMGVEAGLAQGALRVSLGWSSVPEDVSAFITAFATVLHRARRRQAA